MATFNKIIIVGYLGRDPELRYTPQGLALCKISLATTEKRKNAKGEAEDITTWFKGTIWGKQAEFANQYLHKGSQVYVEGRLRQEEWTDRDGQKRYNLEINVSDIQALGPKSGDAAPSSPEDAQKRRDALKGSGDSDIPF